MKKYILSLDQGTTSSRAILFNKNAEIVDQENIEFRQIYPKPGWVEHSPEEIYDTIIKAVNTIVTRKRILFSEIDSIGITNQRETTILWDKKTGKPVHNAIVWQCRRTAERCEDIKKSGYDNTIFEKTGLIVDPYFSATKIEYLLNTIPGLRERAINGEIAFGTVDSWLVYNLTKGKHHITDYSNASRTMLFNINTLKWDKELLDYFRIPEQILPKVVSNCVPNVWTDKSIFGEEIQIGGIIGDQQSALFGQRCFKEGDIKKHLWYRLFLINEYWK